MIFENYKLVFLAQMAFQVRRNFHIDDDDIYWIYCFSSGSSCLYPNPVVV